ncbi:MAG TPA: hypothetical protein VIC62_22230, partial [Nakamurella sp.]
MSRDVTHRVRAHPVPEPDRGRELAGRELSQLGDVEQVAGRVGQQPVEQCPRLPGQLPDDRRRDVRGPVGQLTRGVGE